MVRIEADQQDVQFGLPNGLHGCLGTVCLFKSCLTEPQVHLIFDQGGRNLHHSQAMVLGAPETLPGRSSPGPNAMELFTDDQLKLLAVERTFHYHAKVRSRRQDTCSVPVLHSLGSLSIPEVPEVLTAVSKYDSGISIFDCVHRCARALLAGTCLTTVASEMAPS